MRAFRLIVYFLSCLALLVIGVIFGVNNSTPIQLRFLTYASPEVPLWIVVLLACILGAVIAIVFCAYELIRLALKVQRHKREIKRLVKKLPPQLIPSDDEEEAEEVTLN